MRAEILELLRTQGAAAASCLKPLRDELNTREDPEEIARRELLALASMSNDKFKAAVDAVDPTISKDLRTVLEGGCAVRTHVRTSPDPTGCEDFQGGV